MHAWKDMWQDEITNPARKWLSVVLECVIDGFAFFRSRFPLLFEECQPTLSKYANSCWEIDYDGAHLTANTDSWAAYIFSRAIPAYSREIRLVVRPVAALTSPPTTLQLRSYRTAASADFCSPKGSNIKTLQNCDLWTTKFCCFGSYCLEYCAIDPACIDHYARTVSEWSKDNTVSFDLRDMIRRFRDCLGR